MTVVAVVAALDMCRMLTGRGDAIMTRPARTEYLAVVDGERRRPDVAGVTVFANVGRLDVRRRLAGCIRAVVAVETVAGDVYVIEVGRQPADGRMAIVTAIAAGDMRRVLARCGYTVVARSAGADYLRVIDGDYRFERNGIVAILADIRRLYMRSTLASRRSAVVTAHAIPHDADMIEDRGKPCRRSMTIVALVI